MKLIVIYQSRSCLYICIDGREIINTRLSLIRYTYNTLTDMSTVDQIVSTQCPSGFHLPMRLFTKRSWTTEEDTLLASVVKKLGAVKWSQIARYIPNRKAKQCRERWVNQLNPKINRQEWTSKEQWILFLAHHLMGNKWSKLSTFLPGRTDNCIKNHWNSIMQKKNWLLQHKLNIEFDSNRESMYAELRSLTNHKTDEGFAEDSVIQTKEQRPKAQRNRSPRRNQLKRKQSSTSDEVSFSNILKTIDERANIALQRKQSYHYSDFGLKSADRTKPANIQCRPDLAKNQVDKENFLEHIEEEEDYPPLPTPVKKLSSLDYLKFAPQ